MPHYHVPKSVGAKGDFGHFQSSEQQADNSMPMVAFDWQDMTCC